MLFQTYGDRMSPAVLFFHAMGVTGASSEPIARYLQDRYFCILPTSTVYCEGQKYVSKLDEIRQPFFMLNISISWEDSNLGYSCQVALNSKAT